jgi:hypothetical protein
METLFCTLTFLPKTTPGEHCPALHGKNAKFWFLYRWNIPHQLQLFRAQNTPSFHNVLVKTLVLHVVQFIR